MNSSLNTPDAITTVILADGIYEIKTLLKDINSVIAKASEIEITLSEVYISENTSRFNKAIIAIADYIPLELESEPQVIGTAADGAKKILITLTPNAGNMTTQFFGRLVKKAGRGVLLFVQQRAFVVNMNATLEMPQRLQIETTSDKSLQVILELLKTTIKK
jgi:hypothetical protein